MATDMDWRDLIDSSFGSGPPHRPVEQRLVAGRRALQRRRIAIGAVAVVAAVCVSGAAWGVLPSEPQSAGPVVTPPDGDTDRREAQVAGSRSVVTWTEEGWEVAPGWVVLDQVDNPVDYQPPKRSVALELRKQSSHLFALAIDDGDGSTSVTTTPVPAGTTLAQWLPAQVDNVRDLEGEPVSKPVRFGVGETLVPAEGVTIIDQMPHPDLPANFAAAKDRTAAAWIEANGKQRFVLVRELGGKEEIIPFTASFANLDRFLSYAEQQYEGGAGLR